jgi:hypothetical protein
VKAYPIELRNLLLVRIGQGISLSSDHREDEEAQAGSQRMRMRKQALKCRGRGRGEELIAKKARPKREQGAEQPISLRRRPTSTKSFGRRFH